jgi:hypothetical protein
MNLNHPNEEKTAEFWNKARFLISAIRTDLMTYTSLVRSGMFGEAERAMNNAVIKHDTLSVHVKQFQASIKQFQASEVTKTYGRIILKAS